MQLSTVRLKYAALAPVLNERSRRVWAATEARAIGHGGIALVERATGISRSTIQRGSRELEASGVSLAPERSRKAGAGRKRATATDATLLTDLDALVEPTAPGDPDSPLRWTSKSVRTLSVALEGLGHAVSHTVVAELLHDLGYSLQGNAKVQEGGQHPDRDAQFRYIAQAVRRDQQRRQPTISVDAKKKELVGDFKNAGREWRPKGKPELVRVHDFKDKQLGKASPYGIYDIAADQGWVNVGVDHDTAQFAVNSIRGWWEHLGQARYPNATRLQVTADCGGSNGNRVRLWKVELQALAQETGLEIHVCHLPPGTSKWNRIEHRLFSYITMNWRGKPLVSLETIINLIGATKTSTGLEVYARLDDREYPPKIRVTNAELAAVNLHREEFHPEWNYSIKPRGYL